MRKTCDPFSSHTHLSELQRQNLHCCSVDFFMQGNELTELDGLAAGAFLPSTKSTSRVLRHKTVATVDEGPGLEWGS